MKGDLALNSQKNKQAGLPLPSAAQPELQNGIGVKKAELLQRITRYTEQNLDRKLTLREIAAKFDVSVSTVTQLFQHCAETTFHQYLTNLRLQKARDLIREGVPLEAVGRMVGYGDHSTFYRAFRGAFGVSPREYRRMLLVEQFYNAE